MLLVQDGELNIGLVRHHGDPPPTQWPLQAGNVRGLNNPNKQAEVQHFAAVNKVGLLLGLVETKIRDVHYQHTLTHMFEGWGSFINNDHHPRGRIWVVWKPFSVLYSNT